MKLVGVCGCCGIVGVVSGVGGYGVCDFNYVNGLWCKLVVWDMVCVLFRCCVICFGF